MQKQKMIETTADFVRRARQLAVPAVAVQTLDQHATARGIAEAVVGEGGKEPPVLAWDCLGGLCGANQPGVAAAKALPGAGPELAGSLGEALRVALGLPREAALLVFNAHRFLHLAEVVQGVMNLRDRFKSDKRLCVLMGPAIDLPAELAQDVATFDEPLPDDEGYAAIACSLVDQANARRRDSGKALVERPSADGLRQIAAAARGLAAYPAEQALTLSLTAAGYDLERLWQTKKRTVEATPGVVFEFDTGVALDDVIGLDALATWVRRVRGGPRAPGAVLFMDEIEKMTAGAGGDTSGVSAALQGKFLTWTQERKHKGILVVGPPGVGKSMLAEAMANELRVPCLKANFGDAKASLVGESERNMSTLLKVIDSVSGDRLLMVATCNREEVLAPELRDRFSFGTWYVGPPSAEAQRRMWAAYAGRAEYEGYAFGEPPTEEHFSGRDISNIVEAAYVQAIDLREAARTSNVPIGVAQPRVVEELEKRAHGVYLSAHRPGVFYRAGSDEARRTERGGRAIELDPEGE